MSGPQELPELLLAVLGSLVDGHALYRPEPPDAPPGCAVLGVWMNAAGLAIRELSEREFVGTDLVARTRAQGNDAEAEAYLSVLRTGEPVARLVVTDTVAVGRRTVEVNAVRIPGPLLSLSFRDVTHELDGRRELQRAAEEMRRQASTDSLTGLLNRRGWEAALTAAIEHSEQTGAPLQLAITDLDLFKAYNDTNGHAAGDELLRGAGRAWLASVGPAVRLARLGGEEFGVAMPSLSVDMARQVLEIMRSRVPAGQTMSAGLTTYVPGERSQALMARADAALYAAKHAGRDRVETLVQG